MQCSVVLILWLGVELVHGGVKPARMAKALSGKETVISRGVYCLVGSEWDSSCGFCRCSDEGRAVCQRREGCNATDKELETQCAPDTIWRNDCNTCWCSDQGRAMCTRMGCSYVIQKDKLPEESSPTKAVAEAIAYDDIQSKTNAKNKEEITRSKSERKSKTGIDDTEHPDVEFSKESLETLDHSFEELDYNIEPENDLNHVHSIQEQNNLLEESIHDKGERHSMLKRSVCKPTEVFQAECNTCKCAPDGQSYVCTHNECMEGEKNKEVEVFMESEGVDHIERHMVCAARGTFYIGCNTCHCNALGTDYSCTNKPCPLPEDVELFHELKTVKSSTNRSTKQVCVANRMFIKDCNTCWCNEDGTRYFCTRKVCVPELPELGVQDKSEELRIILKECRPDEVFELNCNMCRCNPDGKSYSCTRRACADVDPIVEPVDPIVEPVVQDAKVLPPVTGPVAENAMVPAVDAQAVQSDVQLIMNPLVQDEKVLPPVAGVVQDATVAASDVSAVQPVDQPVAEPVVKAENQPLVRKSRATEEVRKACQPGQEFRMDCNTCLCDDKGKDFSCTRHDCNTPPENTRSKREAPESAAENVTMQCVAGSVFNRDCNVCRCADDGQRALCTHKPCVVPTSPNTSGGTSPDTSAVPESDPNFRCNPGEQLKRGCNDCQCSADGRSVFCTVRFCDQDITPPTPNV